MDPVLPDCWYQGRKNTFKSCIAGKRDRDTKTGLPDKYKEYKSPAEGSQISVAEYFVRPWKYHLEIKKIILVRQKANAKALLI